MLEYLVTSRTRRELLRRLWLEGKGGSVSALARACGVSFAGAHRELEAMKAAGLAVVERQGLETVYRADDRHPEADVLRALLSPRDDSRRPAERQPSASAESTLADKLVLSHEDEAVALALPLELWRQRDELDHRHLVREATRRNERQTLGFFLQLAGRLGGESRLSLRASALKDRRRTALRPFFSTAGAADATSGKSLPLARRWGYVLNIDLARFAAAFKRESRSPRG
ncbi:MAG: helix-turn-helix domain-containing protein [Vicinamibacteria bacterium]